MSCLSQGRRGSVSIHAPTPLIDAIVLTPEEGTLKIELQGNLVAMLQAAQARSSNDGMLAPLGRWEDERSPDTEDLVQIMLVAGGGFEPPTFGL